NVLGERARERGFAEHAKRPAAQGLVGEAGGAVPAGDDRIHHAPRPHRGCTGRRLVAVRLDVTGRVAAEDVRRGHGRGRDAPERPDVVMVEGRGAHPDQRPAGPRHGFRQLADGQVGQRVLAAHGRRIHRKHFGDRSMVLTMRLDTVLEGRRQPVFSFEFFPPKTDDGVRQLFEAISHLRDLEPTFVSVTYGAGGSVRTRTVDLVTRTRRELDIEPVAHLTCVDATVDDLRGILDGLRQAGIDNVLALRGDPPEGDERFVATLGGLAHGNELMELITADYGFCVGGACYPEKHPESADADEDVRSAKRKADAGASYLITNLFFDNTMYFDFVARARAAGVTVPIIPGIMPVTNVGQIRRFTSKIGATIPDALLEALRSRETDPEAVLQLGVAWATLQCAELLAGGAPGVHFYTMNRSPATRAILSALRAARPWDR